jgi:DNA primase
MSISQEVKSRLDIVEIVEEYLPLRKSGSSYSGFCPFHPNTKTPAFAVFPDSQSWRCFGACAEGGDIFSFVMKKEGWDFREALEHLARRAGVELTPLTPVQHARQEEADRLVNLLDAAADYFHQLLTYAPQAEAARRYVAERQLADETIGAFRLGFALDSWDAARTHFTGQGYDIDDLLDAGLLSKNEERGTTYDRFRNRLMIPIRDGQGRTVGFGARTLDPDGVPKYLNSPQTTLFDKSNLLYGLDASKRHIREARQAVIVEGYMDVMQAHQHGFKNVVAQMGTALTEAQLILLKRYTKRFIIALDADEAGMKATLRSLEVARRTLDREADVVGFDPRGLVRQEGRLQADIRIVTLPAGNDPDKIIREKPGLWPELLSSAKPIVAYVIDVYTRDLDLQDGKAKTEAAQKVLPLINDVADPVEREHYRQQLARALAVDERVLRQMRVTGQAQARQTPPPRSGPSPPRSGPPPPPEEEPLPGTRARPQYRLGQLFITEHREVNYLRQVLSQPHLLKEVDRRLQDESLPAVGTRDFTVQEDRELFTRLRAAVYRGQYAGGEALLGELDVSSQQRLSELMEEAADQTGSKNAPTAPDTGDSLALSVLNCRVEKVRQELSAVQQLLHGADRERARELLETIGALQQQILQLDRAKGAMLAVNRRRAEEKGALSRR